MRSWHDDAPTSPFVNKEKCCAFKRPSYTGIPVLVSCIVLKGPLKCCLRAVSQLGGISSHFRTEFGFLQFVCVFLPLFLLKGLSFMVSMSFWSLWLLSSGWFLFVTGCWCTRVATAQGKQGIWFLLFPDRENTGNFALTQGKILRHRENIFL